MAVRRVIGMAVRPSTCHVQPSSTTRLPRDTTLGMDSRRPHHRSLAKLSEVRIANDCTVVDKIKTRSTILEPEAYLDGPICSAWHSPCRCSDGWRGRLFNQACDFWFVLSVRYGSRTAIRSRRLAGSHRNRRSLRCWFVHKYNVGVVAVLDAKVFGRIHFCPLPGCR